MAKEKNIVKTVGKQPKRKPGFAKGDPNINRKGRPAGSRDWYTDFMEAAKKLKDPKTGKTLTRVDILGIILQYGMRGDRTLLGRVEDRLYGKVPDTLRLENTEGDDDENDTKFVDKFFSSFIDKKK